MKRRFRFDERSGKLVEMAGPGTVRKQICWPMIEDALAVHPDQIPEAIEAAREHGVPTDFTKDGQPILTSRSHARDYHRSRGVFNKDAGYGDAAPLKARTPGAGRLSRAELRVIARDMIARWERGG